MSLKSATDHIPYECDNLIKMNITDYQQLIRLKQIELSSPPTEVEKNIIITNCHNLEKMIVVDDNYKFIFDFAPFIKKNNIKLELKLNPIKSFDTRELRNFSNSFPNAYIMYGYEDVTIEHFIYVQEQLDNMLNPIKNMNLSPFEQFIYIFYITSHFREYKDLKYYEDKARSLFEIFKPDNNLIVCGGFAEILRELCKRFDIKTRKMYVRIYSVSNNGIKYDSGHFRNILRLVDNKYNIDGIYISDPTWNNVLNSDLLTTLLLTPLESLSLFNYRLGLGSYDVLSAQDYDEFQCYIYKDFKYNNAKDFNTTLNTLLYMYPELSTMLEHTALTTILKKCKTITKECYTSVINDTKAMSILFNFIHKVCNKMIDGSIIIEAMINLKQKLNPQMTEQELKVYRESIINQNINDFDTIFPKLVAYKNGMCEIVLENQENKFRKGTNRL